jgi:hypothetical protein
MARTANPNRISKVDVTNDTLTGRAGMALFVRYLTTIGLLPLLGTAFGRMRKSAKGLAVCQLFQQVFCLLFDGTSRHLRYFDALSQDRGYAAVIETDEKEMASSHQIKRFFRGFGLWCLPVFRKILTMLFEWRLWIERPAEVRLTLDTMVMDNDEAPKRQGVEPTYKNKKGFQPLHMLWNHKIIDAVFRGGKKHGNHGATAENMIRRVVSTIRRVCGPTGKTGRYRRGYAKPLVSGEQPYILPGLVEGKGIFIIAPNPNSIKHVAGAQVFSISHSRLSVDDH